MRLTSFTDYTLRVLIYLGAHQGENHLATIGDIAAAYGISENHLMKVVHQLGQQGYVETVRGKGGGIRLARKPALINLGEVVRAAEDDLAIVECFQPGNDRCPIAPTCALQGVLRGALDAFLNVLDRRTLADLLRPRQQLARIFRASSIRHAP